MKSTYFGHARTGEKMHTVNFFDGRRMREIDVMVAGESITRLNQQIAGIIETGMHYRTAKRKIAAYEKTVMRVY